MITSAYSLLFDSSRGPQYRRVEILFGQIEFVFDRECPIDPPSLANFTTADTSYFFVLRRGRYACGSVCQTLLSSGLLARLRIGEMK
jgi:hypothetical protein